MSRERPNAARHSAAAVLLLLALVAAPGVRAAEQAPLDVRADRVELDQRAGVARFEGGVVARQDAVELRCERLTARYGESGEVTAVVAEGGVRVTSERLAATAERARFDRAAGVLVLTGEPEVRRGDDRLRGETIRIWPEAGRVVVEKARGRITVPRIAREGGALGVLAPASEPAASPRRPGGRR